VVTLSAPTFICGLSMQENEETIFTRILSVWYVSIVLLTYRITAVDMVRRHENLKVNASGIRSLIRPLTFIPVSLASQQ
jgi:hypothetical protein